MEQKRNTFKYLFKVKYFKTICTEIKVLVTAHNLLDNKLLNYAKTERSLRSRQFALADSAVKAKIYNNLHATYIKVLIPLQRKWIGQFKYS